MEILITALATVLVTAIPAYFLHKRELKKDATAGKIATAAMHEALDTRMRAHVDFVEARIQAEREWFRDELERERQECEEAIDRLAGRLGVAESKLKRVHRVESNGEESGDNPA